MLPEDLETHFPQVNPESTQIRPCCSVCPLGHEVRFFVNPVSQREQSRGVLDPKQTPVVVQLVHVLLPALVYRVVQLEHDVAVPPFEYVPEEQAVQVPFFK